MGDIIPIMKIVRIEHGIPYRHQVVCDEYRDNCVFRANGACNRDKESNSCASPNELLEIEEGKRRPNKSILEKLRRVVF
jgi:hypothetical protein